MNKEENKETNAGQEPAEQAEVNAEETAAAETEVVNDEQTETSEKQEEKVWTPEEIKELQEKASKAEEYWNKLLQLVADFD
ncbi:MAG: hypothetical protein IKQ24_04625, partial [Verrucomicrobia bacterium]|nr:hypothetical protein [Verrucomicrobiota bacterium]